MNHFNRGSHIQASVRIKMYEDFTQLFLGNTDVKKTIDSEFHDHIPSVERALKLYNLDELSFDSKISLIKVITRNIRVLNENSLFQQNYKFLGKSPRVQVERMGLHITSVKSGIRNEIFRKMNVWNSRYLYVDVDLKSAFASICEGLYPKQFPICAKALERGLWLFIKETTFKGIENTFEKKNVKICVYSSYFGARYDSFVKGILDRKRKDIGLTPYEWKFVNTKEMEIFRNSAEYIATKMVNSDLLTEARNASKYIHQKHKGRLLKCPSGHQFMINRECYWNSVFSLHLQGYEQFLVQNTCILMSKYYSEPELCFIASFHDGFIVRIEKNLKKEIFNRFNEALKKIAVSINLNNNILFEFKEL
jgi:hypothetical protein